MQKKQSSHIVSSHKLLSIIIERGEAKHLAPIFGVKSGVAVRQYCREPEGDDSSKTGRVNPLERIIRFIRWLQENDNSNVRSRLIADYVSRAAYGMHIDGPKIDEYISDEDLIKEIADTFEVMGKMINEIRESWFVESPGVFTHQEAVQCTSSCHEALKQVARLKRLVNLSAWNSSCPL